MKTPAKNRKKNTGEPDLKFLTGAQRYHRLKVAVIPYLREAGEFEEHFQ